MNTDLNKVIYIFLLVCFFTYALAYFDHWTSVVILLVFWLSFLLSLMYLLSQHRKIGSLIVLVVFTVCLGFLAPRSITISVLEYPNALLNYLGFAISAGKVLHVIVYAILGASYGRLMQHLSRKRSSEQYLLTVALLVGIVMSEVFQLYAPNRSSSLKDVTYNAIGVTTGLFLFITCHLIRKIKASHHRCI